MNAERWMRVRAGLAGLLMTALVTGAAPSRAASVAPVAAAARAVGHGAAESVPPPPPEGVVRVLAVGRVWPVGTRPRVARGWEPPATAYGPGHRGVDLVSAPGAPVRAVAAGRVSFAGRVAGRGVVSVELTGTGAPPLRTTYEPVRASVEKGDAVAAGDVLGVLQVPDLGAHCGAPCLHWGLLRAETYLNPLSLLPPWLLGRGPSRLLPVAGVPEGPPGPPGQPGGSPPDPPEEPPPGPLEEPPPSPPGEPPEGPAREKPPWAPRSDARAPADPAGSARPAEP
ncbi:hypothetical protein GCM10010358_59390 [Streptomyces minutiscleroticus]|uniref:M23ase beta-sheet core domain-containing protein n=1 Tax=Streptomyces minutiscleroticus TaxID=68238 RepID=A0A918NV14_9ACTN|nr:hypothetical protein GCM10010358_59390 [Streptomyces minutiscleroticus]